MRVNRLRQFSVSSAHIQSKQAFAFGLGLHSFENILIALVIRSLCQENLSSPIYTRQSFFHIGCKMNSVSVARHFEYFLNHIHKALSLAEDYKLIIIRVQKELKSKVGCFNGVCAENIGDLENGFKLYLKGLSIWIVYSGVNIMRTTMWKSSIYFIPESWEINWYNHSYKWRF